MSVGFVDRYSGTAAPNSWTGCRDRCEGLGVYPMPFEEWEAAPSRERPRLCPQRDENDRWEPFPPPHGEYVFVFCPACGGTGRTKNGRLGDALDVAHTFWYSLWWPLWAFRHELKHGFAASNRESRLRVAARQMPRNLGFSWRDQATQRRMLRAKRRTAGR